MDEDEDEAKDGTGDGAADDRGEADELASVINDDSDADVLNDDGEGDDIADDADDGRDGGFVIVDGNWKTTALSRLRQMRL